MRCNRWAISVPLVTVSGLLDGLSCTVDNKNKRHGLAWVSHGSTSLSAALSVVTMSLKDLITNKIFNGEMKVVGLPGPPRHF